jgi:glycosyltransferase involved in cell wall biosynthesis
MIIGAGPEKKALEDYIRESGLSNLICFLGYVPAVHLPAIYKMAYALIYPSFYEGFGIPIVEALRQKTPVIASNTSAMPESTGPGGLLINPADPDDLADAMQQLLEDSILHQQLSEAGYRHSLKYNPETICKEQMDIYREMVKL